MKEYTAIVRQIICERDGNFLLPVQVDDLLFSLYSMLRGNKRLQNDYQNAIAQVPHDILEYYQNADCSVHLGIRI